MMSNWVCLKMTPKNPMVLLIIIPFLNGYFIGGYWGYTLFSEKHIYRNNGQSTLDTEKIMTMGISLRR